MLPLCEALNDHVAKDLGLDRGYGLLVWLKIGRLRVNPCDSAVEPVGARRGGYAGVDVQMIVVGGFAGDPNLPDVVALSMHERIIKTELRPESTRDDLWNLPRCSRVYVVDVDECERRYTTSGVEYYLTVFFIGIKPVEPVLKY